MFVKRIEIATLRIALTFIVAGVLGGPATARAHEAQSPSEDHPPRQKPEKKNTLDWTDQIMGRRYYLRNSNFPLLINDCVEVIRCKIKFVSDSSLDTGVVQSFYTAKIRLQGTAPAPQNQIRFNVDEFQTLEDLDSRLRRVFSIAPLEDAFGWPLEIKQQVRARYIALGMDKQMVDLALGGLGYQVDLEKLDDGRIRETWKLQVKGDTRKVFTTRTAVRQVQTQESSQASGSVTTSPASSQIHLTGSSSGQTVETITESGFFIFSGLPPQFLNVIFTDGRVTAR